MRKPWYEIYDSQLVFCVKWINDYLEKIKNGEKPSCLQTSLYDLIDFMDLVELKGDYPSEARKKYHEFRSGKNQDHIEFENGKIRKNLEAIANSELTDIRDEMVNDCMLNYFNESRSERDILWVVEAYKICNGEPGEFREYFIEAKNPIKAVQLVRKKHGEIHFMKALEDIEGVEPCECRYLERDYSMTFPEEKYWCGNSLDQVECAINGDRCSVSKEELNRIPVKKLKEFLLPGLT